MINVGVNGFGRIGKCVFLQLINKSNFSIKCLNALNIKINEIEDYLSYDTTHGKKLNIKVRIINQDTFQINHHIIKLVSDRNAKNIDWDKNGCEYLIDATGAYLTTEKCNEHNAKYVVMTSPAKDDTKTVIYGVNEDTYNGEKVISGSSCTTNCVSPLLKLLNTEYEIKDCVFTTIHATTASQYVVDVLEETSRINRSILNNIIPHKTDVSSSIINVIPELNGKINGTSVRVPVVNCSLVDINIQLENTNVTMNDIINLLKNQQTYKTIYDISDKKLVSCDFLTTITPTILDVNASIDMGNGKFKLFVWYDNEWSYSAQIIRLVEFMFQNNNSLIKQKYFFENISMKNKGIVCRLDFNVPLDASGQIIDDYRIVSSIPTIQKIIEKQPKYIILVSHFGKPTQYDEKLSLKFMIPILEKLLNRKIFFLEHGLSEKTLEKIQKIQNGIYLLENIRFHEEEIMYEKGLIDDTILNIYKNLGDVFICDAFGCMRRNHLSICAMSKFKKPYGFGYLIQKELNNINNVINNKNKKVLAIIGGNKIDDKIPIIESLHKISKTTIFIAGEIAKKYPVNDKAKIYYNDDDNNNDDTKQEFVMIDGYGCEDLSVVNSYNYIEDIFNTNLNVYDIGYKTSVKLMDLILDCDIIFWNGSLGLIEDKRFINGSKQIMEYLHVLEHKTVIICGYETTSLLKHIEKERELEKEKNIKNNIKHKIQNKTNHIYISAGESSLLEYLQNKILQNYTLIGLEIFQK